MPKIIFVTDKGEEEFDAPNGLSVMEAAHKFMVDIEGACGGSLACATCHVVVEEPWFNKLNEHAEISEDEEDMLDLAFNLKPTSRLGCQIIMSDALDGIKVYLPKFA